MAEITTVGIGSTFAGTSPVEDRTGLITAVTDAKRLAEDRDEIGESGTRRGKLFARACDVNAQSWVLAAFSYLFFLAFW